MSKYIKYTCDDCGEEMLLQDIGKEPELIPNCIILTSTKNNPTNLYFCSYKCLIDHVNS